MSSDVDTQIRDALYAVVGRTPSTHERASDLMRRAVSRRRRRRRAWSVAAGSALFVAAMVTVAVLVGNGSGDLGPNVRTANSTTEPPTRPSTTDAATRVAIGDISLTVPPGFAIESQSDLAYKDGSGRSVLIGAGAAREGGAARCQVAWVKWTVSPRETRPHTTVQVDPVDGSASFPMDRVEGSDTDLSARIGQTESFIVDCDDLATARFVAAHLTIPD